MLGAVLASCAAIPAKAQDIPPNAPPLVTYSDADVLLRQLNTGTAREQDIAKIVAPLRNADSDGNGLDRADLEQIKRSNRASRRSSVASQSIRLDFDEDLRLTMAELIANSRSGTQEQRERNAERQMTRFDANGDGVATLDEALSTAHDPLRRRTNSVEPLLALDPNGDGRLTAQELITIAETTFEQFDTDGNNIISAEEREVVQSTQREILAQRRLIEAGCKMTPASPEAQIIAFGTYSAKRVSSAYVGSANFETGVIDIVIEPGDAPLYLIMGTFRANIWRFSGATHRVERVVATSIESAEKEVRRKARNRTRDPILTSAAGVVGLPKDIVLIAGPECGAGYRLTLDNREQTDLLAKVVAGRATDIATSAQGPYTIAMPSMTSKEPETLSPPPPASALFKSQRWRALKYDDPSLLVTIDPSKVIAAEAVGAHDPLPGHYGIEQMVKQGVLEPDDQGRLRVLKDVKSWPVGLTSGSSVAFVVTPGVSVPEERPGISCVMTEAEAESDNWEPDCRKKIAPPPPIQLNTSRD